jgi:hypothetical protein
MAMQYLVLGNDRGFDQVESAQEREAEHLSTGDDRGQFLLLIGPSGKGPWQEVEYFGVSDPALIDRIHQGTQTPRPGGDLRRERHSVSVPMTRVPRYANDEKHDSRALIHGPTGSARTPCTVDIGWEALLLCGAGPWSILGRLPYAPST